MTTVPPAVMPDRDELISRSVATNAITNDLIARSVAPDYDDLLVIEHNRGMLPFDDDLRRLHREGITLDVLTDLGSRIVTYMRRVAITTEDTPDDTSLERMIKFSKSLVLAPTYDDIDIEYLVADRNIVAAKAMRVQVETDLEGFPSPRNHDALVLSHEVPAMLADVVWLIYKQG